MPRLQLFHENGNVHYQGFTKSNHFLGKKLIDTVGIFLPYFEGEVREFDEKKNHTRTFRIEKGKQVPLQTVSNEKKIMHDFFSKFVYTGEVDSNGSWCGEGSLVIERDNQKVIYTGSFLDGKRHGEGRLQTSEGKTLLSGSWCNDKPHGYMECFAPDSTLFLKGHWVSGYPQSKCQVYSSDGLCVFAGDWNEYCGKGLLYDNLYGFIKYQGTFQNGLYHGEGTLQYILNDFPDLESIVGQFANGKPHGEAKIYDMVTYLIFHGQFAHGKKDGFGLEIIDHTYVSSAGNYSNGTQHGKRIEFRMQSVIYDEKVSLSQWKSYCSEWSRKSDVVCQGNYRHGSFLEGTTYYENGNIQYQGGFKKRDRPDIFYDYGLIAHVYHGYGKTYYPTGKLCYEGNWDSHLQVGTGVYHSEDGSQKVANVYNDSGKTWTGYGVYFCTTEHNQEVLYHGRLRNGVPHGDGILFEYMDNSKKIQSVFSGEFYDGKYCEDNIMYNTLHETVFEGEHDSEGHFLNGVEFITTDIANSDFLEIEEVQWLDGKIFDEAASRREARHKLNLSLYLDTKNHKFLKNVPRSTCVTMYREMFGPKTHFRRMSKNVLVRNMMTFRKKSKDAREEDTDLFGNELKHPVRGYDDQMYDLKSMIHLFQVNDENEYTTLSYHYENDQRTPNFPNTGYANRLEGFYMVYQSKHVFCNKVKTVPDKSFHSIRYNENEVGSFETQ